MRKIYKKWWRNWCEKVKEHNAPLEKDWSCCEEIWSPYDIFIGPIAGIIFSGFIAFILFALCGITGVIESLNMLIFIFFFVSIIVSIFAFFNWKVYS